VQINGFHTRNFMLVFMLASYLFSNCQSHSNQAETMNNPDTLQNRQPAVAGQFYPSNAAELQQMLKLYFAKAPAPVADSEVIAIISPHAGYVFSGEVAAAAFNQLDPEKEYKTIFIIGCSHRNSFPGASVYSIGNYITPLGMVKTDLEIARKLAAENKILAYDPQYQKGEHSIEVQVPFLQYHLKQDFRIVPILLGTQDERICEKIATAMKPYFTPDNLFVISTDFSHYPEYKAAIKTDKQIADAIVTNNPDTFLNAVENCTEKNVANLATGCCSWPSVITLMYLTHEMPGISYKQILYKNSGDSEYGEKDRVVGYYALSVLEQKQKTMKLSETEEKALLEIARNTILTYLKEKRIPDIDAETLPKSLREKAGAFVTLKRSGDLRGCIGHFEADNPLYKIVQQMAVASATQDYRFETVTPLEMKLIDIEISVLTPMQKISNVNSIRLGTDGIYISKGGRSGTFLPQVATDTGWSLEEFLGHCARDKAGIGWDGWKDKDAEIFVYQAFVFGEKE
jgi:AmmeMemoRadiSam system protein B/AmmeMemoRadiSam system protein A